MNSGHRPRMPLLPSCSYSLDGALRLSSTAPNCPGTGERQVVNSVMVQEPSLRCSLQEEGVLRPQRLQSQPRGEGTVNGHRLPLPLHITPKPSWLLTFSLIKTIMSCLHTCMLSCVSFATPWTGTSCHFLLQGIFLTQGLNLGLLHLLHLQADSLPLSHLECRVWFSCYVVSKSLQPHGL